MKLVQQLWYILTPRERTEGAILLCAMVLGAFLETLSVGVVFPFIAVLQKPELFSKSSYLRPFLPHLTVSEPKVLFFILGLVLIALFAIKTGYLILLYRWLFRYSMKKQVSLSRQLLDGYLSAPYILHVQRNSAELIRVVTRSVEDFANIFLVNLLIVLGELFVLCAVTGFLMYVEPLGTLGALLILAVPTALVYRATQRGLARSGRIAEQSFGRMIQWAEQAIGGVKEITITGRRSFFIDHHSYYVQQFTDGLRRLTFLTTAPRFIIDTLAVAAMVAITAILLSRGQDLQSSLLVLGMFALAAIRLIPSTSRLSSALAQLRYRYASTEIIYQELLALRRRPSDAPQDSAPPKISPIPLRRGLAVEQLIFYYPGAPRPAIEGVSLEILKGQWVAFIGPTGAGKTTLADLILGLLAPSSGRILADGRDIIENLSGWQHNVGYVQQTVYLIDDTIRRNVAFGAPDAEIEDERVWQALRAAQVDHLVRSLPEELDAIVGERGGRLSGGERQRLGIARALYYDPEVIVIDEGTANLDPATEAAIVETLGGLRGKKTIIAIAHRLALVRNCDFIYMLDKGRLRNSGRYADLVSKDLAFLEFCQEMPTAIAAAEQSSG